MSKSDFQAQAGFTGDIPYSVRHTPFNRLSMQWKISIVVLFSATFVSTEVLDLGDLGQYDGKTVSDPVVST
jgi:hypothetical protein